jgi:hypothetical protein
MCGETMEEALAYLEELERLTAPDLMWLVTQPRELE